MDFEMLEKTMKDMGLAEVFRPPAKVNRQEMARRRIAARARKTRRRRMGEKLRERNRELKKELKALERKVRALERKLERVGNGKDRGRRPGAVEAFRRAG